VRSFLNTLPPGRIPLALLIKISLKSLTGKKEEAEHKGASFVSLSLGFNPKSAEPVNNDRGFVSRLGAVGWREKLYPVELLKRLSF